MPHRPLPPPPAAYALARDAFGREIAPPPAPGPVAADAATPKKEMATDALGRRVGALSDEIDFPAFVSSLVHGTFDAMVDASIRQMQSFADLVAAVAKPLDQFTQENVSANQARDYLVEQHPRDLTLVGRDGDLTLAPVPGSDPGTSPAWLSEYGLDGAELSAELLEQQLLPAARERVARDRLQTLSTLVLLGMNRVLIRDGTIGAHVRFRAAAADRAAMQYASGGDPAGGPEAWGRLGTTPGALTKVSTVGVNVQSDSELKAELFGEVKINFSSEAVSLDRFLDEARRGLLERHARRAPTASAPAPAALPLPATPVPVAALPAAPPAPVPAAPGGTR